MSNDCNKIFVVVVNILALKKIKYSSIEINQLMKIDHQMHTHTHAHSSATIKTNYKTFDDSYQNLIFGNKKKIQNSIVLFVLIFFSLFFQYQ